jgi:hypothetical protein
VPRLPVLRSVVSGVMAAAVFATVATSASAAREPTPRSAMVAAIRPICVYHPLTGHLIVCEDIFNTQRICLYNPLTGQKIRCVPSSRRSASRGLAGDSGRRAGVASPTKGAIGRAA